MPRERTLSHGFFTNHLLASCEPVARLLFQGIWTVADFDGCFQWDPPALAMKLLPRDQFDPVAAMDKLEGDGFLKSYRASVGKFGYVVNWHKYQDPHPAEKAIHPKPEDDPNFIVRVKAPIYRKPEDLGFGRPDIQKGIYPYQQVVSKLLESCQQVDSNAYLSNLSNLSSPTKEKELLEPLAPVLPLVKAKKEKKAPKVKTTELRPESLEAFQEAWVFIPKTFRKWDQEIRDYVEEPVAKGNRLQAERNFQRVVDAGVATPMDLCYALQAYVLEGEMPKKGFFQHVSTFFGPEKSTYLEWLERSKQVQKELYEQSLG